MKNTLKLLAVGTTFAFASVSAHAAGPFVGLTLGETSNNMQRSGSLQQNLPNTNFDNVIKNKGTWGIRAGQQTDEARYYATYENISDTYASQYKLRQQNLLGSYDAFLPVGDSTRLFGGVTLGLVKLEQESKGFSRDRDISYAGGLQAGVLQQVADNLSLEAGYRYLRTGADVDLAPHGGAKLGSLDLRSSKQAYLGVNYQF